MFADSLGRIIENVVTETVPRTIRLRVSVVQTRYQAGAPSSPSSLTLEQTYAETAVGERYFDEVRTEPRGSVSHVSSFCDGAKCANVRFLPEEPDTQDRVTIGHEFMNEVRFGFRDGPAPFRFYHVGLTPLHEALADAERIGQERVIERTCNRFHFRAVGPPGARESLVYSLDETTSVPLKIAAYANPDQIGDQAPNWVWEATTLDGVSGRHYPRASKYSSFRVTRTDSGGWASKPTLSKMIKVDEIAFDVAIPKATFWPTIQPGVKVWDSIAKRHYQTPGAVQLTREAMGAGQPVRVAPESESWLPSVGVALSVAVLGAAGVLWRRSR
jgi:hypothetical protein